MMPFTRLIVPAGLGILFPFVTGLAWEYAAACFILSWTVSWFCLKRRDITLSLYPWLSVFFFFACVTSVMTPKTDGLPGGDYIHAEVVLAEQPVQNGKWQQAKGDIVSYKISGDPVYVRAAVGVQLYIDSCYYANAGDRLLVKGYFNTFGEKEGSYGALMTRRGIAGRMYVTEGSLLALSASGSGWLARVHDAAVGKMSAMPGSGERNSVAAAMVSGDKRAIPRDVRNTYRDGGGAHLLAVSGLHVGIVFVIVNLLLYFIPAMRRGHIVKNILAIVAVWLFAVAAGLSPSVVRAALMFSFVQFALAAGGRRNALNIIAASAFIMLAIDPNYAADPSFVLSYAAVLAIILFFGPFYGMIKTRYKLLNAILSIYLVGIIASLAVAPFVSYWFGSVPFSGIIVNPVVILTAHIIVGVGAIWLLWPFGFGGGIFGWITDKAVTLQDNMMHWCASLEWSGVDIRLPLWLAVTVYCMIIFSSLPLQKYVESRRRRLTLPV